MCFLRSGHHHENTVLDNLTEEKEKAYAEFMILELVYGRSNLELLRNVLNVWCWKRDD